MALSEGFKGFVDFVTKSFTGNDERDTFGFDEEDGGYMTDVIEGNVVKKPEMDDIDAIYGPKNKPSKFGRDTNVTVHPNSYKSGEVTVIEPRSFSESVQIVKKLSENKTVVLHLDLLDKEQSQRTIDFVCGAAHALNGTAQKISDMVFIFTPSNVSLCVENGTTQNKFAESLWNRPL